MQGNFMVKDKQGEFEQTIQRVSKDPGGAIGEQREETYVPELNLVFHETYLFDDFFNNFTR